MANVAEKIETAVVEKEKETVEKEVEDVDTPKVAEVEEKADLPNGKEAAPAVVADATDNGTTEKAAEEEPSKEAEEEKKENNGESTDAPAEAVKRKVTDAPEGTPATDETPEKKSKLAESEVETNGIVDAEVTA